MIISTAIPAQSCRRCLRRRGDRRRQSTATARATASTLALAATAAAAMTMLSFAPVVHSFATTTTTATTAARGCGIPPFPSVALSTSPWAAGAASASGFARVNRRRSETTCPGGGSGGGSTCRGYANYVDDARSLDNEEQTSSFERRMREQFLKTSRGERGDAATATAAVMPSNVCTAETLEQYRTAVGDEKERLVAVRFHAAWCRSCKAIAPAFYRLARRHPDVRFVEVPVTQHNAMLHQGLGVPSVPFGHIYHPAAGLVEEMRMSNKGGMSDFASVLGTYVDGQCQFPAEGDCSNPYE